MRLSPGLELLLLPGPVVPLLLPDVLSAALKPLLHDVEGVDGVEDVPLTSCLEPLGQLVGDVAHLGHGAAHLRHAIQLGQGRVGGDLLEDSLSWGWGVNVWPLS